jgi:hypothetical protein
MDVLIDTDPAMGLSEATPRTVSRSGWRSSPSVGGGRQQIRAETGIGLRLADALPESFVDSFRVDAATEKSAQPKTKRHSAASRGWFAQCLVPSTFSDNAKTVGVMSR